MIKNPYKVKLQSFSHGRYTTPRQEVIFDVMPTISESHGVDYQSYDPIHAPGSYNVYRGTKAVAFEISAKFISRTNSEATQNQARLNILRGWTRSYFGFGTGSKGNTGSKDVVATRYETKGDNGMQPLTRQQLLNVALQPTADSMSKALNNGLISQTQFNSVIAQVGNNAANNSASDADVTATAKKYLDNLNQSQLTSRFGITRTDTVVGQEEYNEGAAMLGAPPDIVYLTAYSDASDSQGVLNRGTNITRIPCIINSISVVWPNDVDYIPTVEGQPFPIVMDVSISLTESHSPKDLEEFDLYKYRKGILPGF